MPKILQVFTDGGARGNPGPAGVGIYICDQQGDVYQASHFLGKTTNNIAEYQGLIKALEWLNTQNLTQYSQIKFYLDSKLVVEQISKNWKIKQPHLQLLAREIWQLLDKLALPYSLIHVRREKNQRADLLANQAMDSLS